MDRREGPAGGEENPDREREDAQPETSGLPLGTDWLMSQLETDAVEVVDEDDSDDGDVGPSDVVEDVEDGGTWLLSDGLDDDADDADDDATRALPLADVPQPRAGRHAGSPVEPPAAAPVVPPATPAAPPAPAAPASPATPDAGTDQADIATRLIRTRRGEQADAPTTGAERGAGASNADEEDARPASGGPSEAAAESTAAGPIPIVSAAPAPSQPFGARRARPAEPDAPAEPDPDAPPAEPARTRRAAPSEPFTWSLTPNDEPDPVVVAREAEKASADAAKSPSAPEPPAPDPDAPPAGVAAAGEPGTAAVGLADAAGVAGAAGLAAAGAAGASDRDDDAPVDTTAAFDPFAEHFADDADRDRPVVPGFESAFSTEASRVRLYDEATLAAVEGARPPATDADASGTDAAVAEASGLVPERNDGDADRSGPSSTAAAGLFGAGAAGAAGAAAAGAAGSAAAASQIPPVVPPPAAPLPILDADALPALDEEHPEEAEDLADELDEGQLSRFLAAGAGSTGSADAPHVSALEASTAVGAPLEDVPHDDAAGGDSSEPAATAVIGAARPASAGPSADGSGSEPPLTRQAAKAEAAPAAPSRPLVMVGIAVVSVLVLVVLFWFGSLIPGMFGAGASTAASPTPSVSETPTPTPKPTAPLAAGGTYAWDALYGGECIDPYDGPWAEEFTVVDCAEAHAAQLVFVGELTDEEFPGEDALTERITGLCTAQGVVDLAAAAAYADVQVQGAYPVTQEQWDEGQRSYYCFVDRASGEDITGSLQGTPAS